MKQYKETDYYITETGEVWSMKSGELKQVKPTLTNKGYKTYRSCINGIRKHISIHRAVAELYIPNHENKPQINHIDGNKLNNHIDNLQWVTNQENRDHAVKNDLHVRGEKCGNSKLTQQQVLEIRELYSSGNYSLSELSKKFQVGVSQIHRIINKLRWKHI